MEKMLRTRFPQNMPKLSELEQRTLLILSNTHPSIDYPESLPPSIIEVGGLQIKDPKPLPKDIETFMNNSKNGAILLAMGTNVRSDLVGTERQNAIIKAITRIPEYNFLWKYDRDAIKGELPKNLFIRNWLPQGDILAHPKLKVFVTHAGALSILESVWYGKPIVAIPLAVDQPRNAHRAVTLRIGEKVPFLTLNEEDLYKAITQVATNPSYTKNVQYRSKLLRDRPMKPLDLAIWWIDYILRNPNPEHLKSPVFAVGYFKANSIDVIVFCLFVLFLVIISFYLVVKNILFDSFQPKRVTKEKLKRK